MNKYWLCLLAFVAGCGYTDEPILLMEDPPEEFSDVGADEGVSVPDPLSLSEFDPPNVECIECEPSSGLFAAATPGTPLLVTLDITSPDNGTVMRGVAGQRIMHPALENKAAEVDILRFPFLLQDLTNRAGVTAVHLRRLDTAVVISTAMVRPESVELPGTPEPWVYFDIAPGALRLPMGLRVVCAVEVDVAATATAGDDFVPLVGQWTLSSDPYSLVLVARRVSDGFLYGTAEVEFGEGELTLFSSGIWRVL